MADTEKAGDAEKAGDHPIAVADLNLHEYAESEGYVIDTEAAETAEVAGKVAKDGHTRLIPQPSDDPNDPLNWSWGVKHLMLFIVAFTAFLPDFGSAIGAVTLLPQAMCVFPLSF